jgi:hypothetical protein
MKKLLPFLLLLVSVQMAKAQYWYLPSISIGQNPGNINRDIEEPIAAVTGWTSILATSASPAWSPTQSLPFSFQFNSAPVTQFKVSSTGVLTFDVGTALAAPPVTNGALPNAAIPNNSICAWGIQGTGANDNIVTKIFGTAPNRQFWIQFSSYSYATAASTFTYWAFVLEETSNKIHIVDQRTGGTGTPVVALAAGLQFSGSSAMSIPGSPTLNTTTSPGGGGNNTYLDNTYYTFTPGVQPINEGAVISMDPKMLTKNSFALSGASVPVTVRIQNQGSAAMSGYTIKINDGANTTNYPQTGSLASGSLSNVNINYNMATAGYKPISLWIEYTGDTNPLNDSAKSEFNGATYSPTKQVVFEEATGTWCQWCPRGAVYMDSIAKVHPEVVAIAVHNADPMVVANYDTPMGALIGGYPSGLVDRKLEADPSDFFTEYNNHKNDFGIADLTVTPTLNGNTISVKVDAKMAIDSRPNYDYRLGLVITQEDMTGTTSQWSQSNAYAGGSNGPMGGFETKSNPVPFSQMVYDHVARAILTDFNGASGSLPANMTAGQTYSHTFSWTVPANTPIMNLKANALLICGLNGEIHNGKWATIYPVSVNDILDETKVVVFPNPANDIVHVDLTLKKPSDFTVSISDMVGRIVYEKTFNALSGNQGLSIPTSNVNSGNYILNIQTSAGSIQRKIAVSH